MNAVALILLLCLASDPTLCKTKNVPLPGVTADQCTARGGVMAGHYAHADPNYVLKEWHCG